MPAGGALRRPTTAWAFAHATRATPGYTATHTSTFPSITAAQTSISTPLRVSPRRIVRYPPQTSASTASIAALSSAEPIGPICTPYQIQRSSAAITRPKPMKISRIFQSW